MPRLETTLIKRAKSIHPYLPLILSATRDLNLARNELRWLAEYQRELKPKAGRRIERRRSAPITTPTLRALCVERSHGRPLQYILGTQPFGELEMLCRKGVFIPRTITERYVHRIAARLASLAPRGEPINIVDPCTGTGCIPLLLYSKLCQTHKVRILGSDISKKAVRLAERNLHHNIARGFLDSNAAGSVQFRHGSLLSSDFRSTLTERGSFDVVVMNPPYLSDEQFRKTTERSVRIFEPRAALTRKTPLGRDQHFKSAACSLLDPIKGGILLCEFISRIPALKYASRLMNSALEQYIFEEKPAVDGAGLQIEIWRDHPEATVARRGTKKFPIYIAAGPHGVFFQGTIALDRKRPNKGSVMALVAAWGKYRYWLKQNPLESNAAQLVQPGQASVTEFLDDAEDSPQLAESTAEPVSVVSQGVDFARDHPAHRHSSSSADITESLAESVDEALDGVKDLSGMVRQQHETQGRIIEEQVALWEELRKLSSRTRR